MATDLQLNANRKNAEASTGPRTESGKATSSRNAVTHGLFTQTDYVRPAEQSEYDDLQTRCLAELKPEGVLEESFVFVIVSARWRPRRCAMVERDLVDLYDRDLLRDAYGRDAQSSIDRARSRAFSQLGRATRELSRLQTERALTRQLFPDQPGLPALVSASRMAVAIDRHRRAQTTTPQPHTNKSASFCKTTSRAPRNSPCPCGSGRKFKRCCGRIAPPLLNPGASPGTLAA